MKFCTSCGSELREGVKFCPSCGKPIQAESQPQSPVNQPVTPPPPPVYQAPQPAYEEPVYGTTKHTNLIQRVINIIIKPKEEWRVIASEKPDTTKLLVGYALILAAIPAIASFIKFGVIGVTYWGYTSRSIAGGIQYGLVQLLSALIGVYILAWIIDLLAPSFDSKKDFGRSLQLAVYSTTPQWLAGILLILGTSMSILVLLIGLYAIYLLAVGMPVLKETPKEKVVGYVVVTIIAMIVLTFVVALIIGAIVGLFFGAKMMGM
ncbi:protein containing zinc-ribbon domain [Lentimicrobium saccharophilum]|uniref:Protein containing zinc-ribbon domain n=1 Tax=Lentimicrobium saccharophilum TaxID=1678841 RepID=A0A0S7BZJ5_9BACT|nr:MULTISPECIES: YIP1 family protein [Lentimicrobium]GAP44027.1 protein containing zinc-ribbon domain [Lentimicrobium saccharophilum]HRW70448.1 YIP1 family protein [Lentimicrobium sp.]